MHSCYIQSSTSSVFFIVLNLGSFGAVYLCRNVNTGERKAVKVFFRGDEKVCFIIFILVRYL
jgi:hypothetical protein